MPSAGPAQSPWCSRSPPPSPPLRENDTGDQPRWELPHRQDELRRERQGGAEKKTSTCQDRRPALRSRSACEPAARRGRATSLRCAHRRARHRGPRHVREGGGGREGQETSLAWPQHPHAHTRTHTHTHTHTFWQWRPCARRRGGQSVKGARGGRASRYRAGCSAAGISHPGMDSGEGARKTVGDAHHGTWRTP
ncbi:unnamed protein product [Prorocentrum cordatum]|uniref:Uncharacterized protein n=1 Tax=Prorocentrum cordatum TaxID=2364126 RepID=A0ABN9Y0N9_9DINO|nr:unnamed protein product [Polarella glacialis]